jgi:hypothetical protein
LPTSVPVGLPPLGALTLKLVAPSFGGFRPPVKLASDWFAFSSFDGLIVIFLFICPTLFDEGLESDGQSESAEKEHPPVSKVQLNKVIAIRFSSIVRHHPLVLWTLSAI